MSSPVKKDVNEDTFTGASFTIENRIKRLVWNFFWTIFFRNIPVPFHEFRSMCLRLFGAKIGRGVHVYPKVKIWAPWNLAIDDESGVANGVTIYNQDLVTLGKRVVISQGAYICSGSHDYEKTGMPLITRPIVLGDYCWITTEVFIHPGVTVGDGCVVGARSVVTRDLPAWKVAAGSPSRVLKDRNWRPE